MSWSVVAGCLWVLASAVVALLPMRRQYVPGVMLLVAAPVLIVWLAIDHGWVLGVIGLIAFVSMFRNPLIYLARKAMGKPVRRPEELEK